MSKQWGHGYYAGISAAEKISKPLTMEQVEKMREFLIDTFRNHSRPISDILYYTRWRSIGNIIGIFTRNIFENSALIANKDIIDKLIHLYITRRILPGKVVTVIYLNGRECQEVLSECDQLGRPLFKKSMQPVS